MQTEHVRRLNKRMVTASILIIFVIPLTLAAGIFLLDDKKYYFISLLVVLYSMLPFFMIFENRHPQARELTVIAALCAIAAAGRAAFFMLPQIKPVTAVVIISGVTLGAESGFLVGAMSGFVSNFFFGQGPWTPWQMFCFGIIGFLAGIFFKKGMLARKKIPICIFGGLAVFFIYGGIINLGSMFMHTSHPSFKALASIYAAGLPFDLSHVIATVFFLYFISEPMIEKLERVKMKYGIIYA